MTLDSWNKDLFMQVLYLVVAFEVEEVKDNFYEPAKSTMLKVWCIFVNLTDYFRIWILIIVCDLLER